MSAKLASAKTFLAAHKTKFLVTALAATAAVVVYENLHVTALEKFIDENDLTEQYRASFTENVE